MHTITLTVSMQIQSAHDLGKLEQTLDRIMETLVDLTDSNPNVSDPSMGVDFSECKVEISLTACGASEGMAIDYMTEVIRKAVDEHGLDYRQIDSTFVAA